MPARVAYSGDGRFLLNKPFAPGYETIVGYIGRLNELLLARINTGYLLSPRGVYGVDPRYRNVRFFYPAAGTITTSVELGDEAHLDFFGPDNGATVTHDSGVLEKDGEVFVRVLKADGTKSPQAGPLPGEDVDGSMRPLVLDWKNDGSPEPQFLLLKDEYNYGTPALYRLEPDGTPIRVHEGQDDSGVRSLQVADDGERQLLSIRWRNPSIQEVLDSSYEVIYRNRYENEARPELFNLDGDDEWEILQIEDGLARITDFEDEPLAEYEISKGQVGSVWLRDLGDDGKTEMVLVGGELIEIRGY